MARIRVSTTIEAPLETVWSYIRRIDLHSEWMADALSINFLGAQTEGVGTSFECLTGVGPFKTTDTMVITQWVDQSAIGVRHTGLFTGEGLFTLTPAGTNRTEFCWTEELQFPWWMIWPVGDVIGARVLEWIWRRNLKTLRNQFETPKATT